MKREDIFENIEFAHMTDHDTGGTKVVEDFKRQVMTACPKVRRKGVKKVVVARTFRNKNTKSFASVGELYANICKN